MASHLTMFRDMSLVKSHPCFSKEAHGRFSRIHLPVAPSCNIQCRYCTRKYDCANESRPGVTSRVLRIAEAVERVRTLSGRNEKISVVGIAGPGDPLANDSTFEVFRRIHGEFPDLMLCVSTNGLLLPERLHDLIGAGVKTLTVTMNAVTKETAGKIYAWISHSGVHHTGEEAADLLLHNQLSGIRQAVDAGIKVKVNTVLIPGINDMEIPLVAQFASEHGAHLMNIIPLIPQAEFIHLGKPGHKMVAKMRAEGEKYLPQMTHCRQCRADACGILGEDGDMELEMINARIGEEYCEVVH